MPRRVSLPGADELFRTTGGASLQAPQPRQHNGAEASQGDPRLRSVPGGGDGEGQETEGAYHPGDERPAGEREDDGGAEHGGRDVPQARRALTAERGTPPSVPPLPPVNAGHQNQLPQKAQPPITAVPQQPSQQAQPGSRRKAPRQNRRPSGRERHDEKITVYVSAEELMDLEHARLVLRGEHGLAIDRGRIVREAVAVVLADLESRGDASILVRRLRGR